MAPTSNPVRAMALLMADARLPSGAHVHSGGMEQAIDDRVVSGIGGLEPYLRGRLMTVGRLSAHVAAQSCVLAAQRDAPAATRWQVMDHEVTARMTSPAQRATSRRQGHSLLRTGMTILAAPALQVLADSAPQGPHLAVVQGATAHHAGLVPSDAALLAAYATVTSAASAALRLLGLDPLAVTALSARLAVEIDEVAAEAAGRAHAGPRRLPAPASPLTDFLAERHAAREERLFAS